MNRQRTRTRGQGWGTRRFRTGAQPIIVLLALLVHAGTAAAQNASILGWGEQVVGEDLGQGFIAVAAGSVHTLGLQADGSIVAWGRNKYSQCLVPEPNSGFVAIATGGGSHSLGLKDGGSIIAWGWNAYGQCDVPAPNANFVAVAGGGSYSLGLKTDGSIVAWGDNEFGQGEIPSPNAGFLGIAAGDWHCLGLKPAAPLLDCSYTVVPTSGTVPFVTQHTVTMTNLYAGQLRRMAGRIDVRTANNQFFTNWRSGFTNLGPGATFTTTWNQAIPALGSVIGNSLFMLATQDVTPSPYNQPPYPPEGDTCTVTDTVTAYQP